MIREAVLAFHYKPGFAFGLSLDTHPGWVLLQMSTAPMPLIGTEVLAPILIQKILPASVLTLSEDEAHDLLLGLVAFWERHEMDEWLDKSEPGLDEEHGIDMVNNQLAHANLAVLRQHARWFKDAPRLGRRFARIHIGPIGHGG